MFRGISIYDFRNQFKTENDCFSKTLKIIAKALNIKVMDLFDFEE